MFQAFTTINDRAKAHQQYNAGGGPTEADVALEKDCVALMLSARTANVYVSFGGAVGGNAAAGEGIEIIAGAQPVFVPLGYDSSPEHTIQCQGAAINALLNILQLAGL